MFSKRYGAGDGGCRASRRSSEVSCVCVCVVTQFPAIPPFFFLAPPPSSSYVCVVVLTRQGLNILFFCCFRGVPQAGVEKGCDEKIGKLIDKVVSSLPEASWQHRPTLLSYIMQKKVATIEQLDAALKYFKTKDTFDAPVFEKMCGVGMFVESCSGVAGPHEAETLV